ncbi:hypothetical protein [Actinosynnema sp. NPDC020468]|uniref:hypothetical protein n=1 Tax=Actinosynnema sp. NPDC020468 TaxID=3154488 RepID=UPI0033F43219
MLKGFVDYLDDHLADVGPSGLLTATLGILAFGSALGSIFGVVAVKAVGFVLASLYVVAALVLLARGRGVQGRRIERLESLLTSYCNLIYTEIDPLWRIDRWEEDVVIARNGDVTASIVVHAFVLADELAFCRVRLGPNWRQPRRARRRVDVRVSSVEVDGTGGTRWERTSSWLADGRLEVLVHFRPTPPVKGEEIRLRFDVSWPGKATPLMRHGDPDDYITMMGLPLAYLSYRVTLPPGTRSRCDVIGLRKGVDDFALDLDTTAQGPVATLVVRDVPADHRVGMRLDLK